MRPLWSNKPTIATKRDAHATNHRDSDHSFTTTTTTVNIVINMQSHDNMIKRVQMLTSFTFKNDRMHFKAQFRLLTVLLT